MGLPLERRLRSPRRLGRYRLYAGLAGLCYLVILALSLLPPPASSAQSSWLVDLVFRLTGLKLEELVLRKLAHFTEYALLGLLSGLALAQLVWRIRDAGLLWLLGLLAAFIDESLQLLSGRGPAILDVWIDGGGMLLGISLALLLHHVLAAARQKSSQAQENKEEGL